MKRNLWRFTLKLVWGISLPKDIFRLAPDPEIAEIGSWTGSFDLLFLEFSFALLIAVDTFLFLIVVPFAVLNVPYTVFNLSIHLLIGFIHVALIINFGVFQKYFYKRKMIRLGGPAPPKVSCMFRLLSLQYTVVKAVVKFNELNHNILCGFCAIVRYGTGMWCGFGHDWSLILENFYNLKISFNFEDLEQRGFGHENNYVNFRISSLWLIFYYQFSIYAIPINWVSMLWGSPITIMRIQLRIYDLPSHWIFISFLNPCYLLPIWIEVNFTCLFNLKYGTYCRGPNAAPASGQEEVPNSQLISCLDSSLGRAAGGRRFAPRPWHVCLGPLLEDRDDPGQVSL